MRNSVCVAGAVGLIAAVMSVTAQGQSGCVKEVFYKYCLGGSVESLLNKYTPIRTTTTKDGATQYIFADGAEQTTVNVVQGRVESVIRRQHPGVQSTFDQVERDLRAIYGEPRRAANEKGGLASTWDRGVWRVLLLHNSIQGIVVLTYRHEALNAARKSAAGNYGSVQNPKGY